MRMKIKKGDKVVVIAGKDRGKTGTVTRALPRENKVLIDGVNVVKKHRRANRARSKGQIVEIAMPVHVSNVMIVDPKDGKPTRITAKKTDGKYVRTTKKSGTVLSS